MGDLLEDFQHEHNWETTDGGDKCIYCGCYKNSIGSIQSRIKEFITEARRLWIEVIGYNEKETEEEIKEFRKKINIRIDEIRKIRMG